MKSGFRFLLITLSALFLYSSAFTQDNPYDPRSQYNPLRMVRRLSYENFRNIKLLQAAILNFGGGMKQVEKLVDEYAEASALFFQNKIPEASRQFTQNQKNILAAAQKVAGVYDKKVNQLIIQIIKYDTKQKIIMDLDGRKRKATPDGLVKNASFSYQKAHDFYIRYKNAKIANPKQLAYAIYYYRRAKENVFLAFKSYLLMGTDYKKLLRLEQNNKLTPLQKKELKEKKYIKQVLSNHEKDMVDNMNKRYKSKEKKN